MDLMLPDHLREPGHRVPRDDPPHDSRPLLQAGADPAPASSQCHRKIESTAPRHPVCGLRDWRAAARPMAAQARRSGTG